MNAFLTGSHAYGTPHEDSDIDLVVMMDPAALTRLFDIIVESGQEETVVQEYEGANDSACLRFGNLNLLVVTREDDYRAWQEGTAELVARKPVTRDEACELFKAKREAVKKARENILAEMVND